MSAIRSKNTKPERSLRKELQKAGLKFKVYSRLPGRPDIVFPEEKFAVFVDGCFWHKCPTCFQMPNTNRAFWKKKINANVARDRSNNRALKKRGWTVIRIREHQIKKNPATPVRRILAHLARLEDQHKD